MRPPTRRSRRRSASREDELEKSLSDISRSSMAALDELWRPQGGGDQVALIDTIEDPAAADPGVLARADRAERGARRGDRAAARAREARRDALLLRGADAARDRRGARGHRVARLAAPHEGGAPAQGAPLGRRRRARPRPNPTRSTRATAGPRRRASSGPDPSTSIDLDRPIRLGRVREGDRLARVDLRLAVGVARASTFTFRPTGRAGTCRRSPARGARPRGRSPGLRVLGPLEPRDGLPARLARDDDRDGRSEGTRAPGAGVTRRRAPGSTSVSAAPRPQA